MIRIAKWLAASAIAVGSAGCAYDGYYDDHTCHGDYGHRDYGDHGYRHAGYRDDGYGDRCEPRRARHWEGRRHRSRDCD